MSFDDDFAIFFEFDRLNHAEVRLFARVAPSLCEDELLAQLRLSSKSLSEFVAWNLTRWS